MSNTHINTSKDQVTFTKKSLWISQAPCFNFELDPDQLLAKALDTGFVRQIGSDLYELNQEETEQV